MALFHFLHSLLFKFSSNRSILVRMKPTIERNSLERIVLNSISEHHMIEPGDKIVVAVSGGVDSVALLCVLNSLFPEMNLELIVAHVNHNLRPGSVKDKDFVENLASRLHLDFYHLDANVRAYSAEHHLSLEESGRIIRYSFFRELLTDLKANRVATAHHVDDQIETVLLRLIRGSVTTGLRGIPAVRGAIIRPFIKVERSQIVEYCRQKGLNYINDETNFEIVADRNFIRNRVLKEIETRFPQYRKSVLRTTELLSRDEEFLEKKAGHLYDLAVKRRDQEIVVDVKHISGADDAIGARVLRSAFYDLTGPDLRLTQINLDQSLSLARSPKPSSSIDLPGFLNIRRDYDKLVISKKSEEQVESYSYTINGPGILELPSAWGTLTFTLLKHLPDEEKIRIDTGKAYFDLDSLEYPLIVRSFMPGDRLEAWGVKGSTKVKKIFIDKKISLSLRRRIPLIIKDDKILWIAGVRRSRLHGLTSLSKRILEITWIKNSNPEKTK